MFRRNDSLNKPINKFGFFWRGYRYRDTVKFITNPNKVMNKTPAIDCCSVHTVLVYEVYSQNDSWD